MPATASSTPTTSAPMNGHRSMSLPPTPGSIHGAKETSPMTAGTMLSSGRTTIMEQARSLFRILWFMI
jgi:hypothetical protein